MRERQVFSWSHRFGDLPGVDFGASSSGTSIMTMSASAAAWATGSTRRPDCSALASEGFPGADPLLPHSPTHAGCLMSKALAAVTNHGNLLRAQASGFASLS